jgi:hypothetical protein
LIATFGGGLALAHFRSSQPSVTNAEAPFVEVLPPLPQRGAVVLAKRDRARVVALAVRPVGKRLDLRVTVVAPGGPVTGLKIGLEPDSSQAKTATETRPCGPGCYRGSATLASAPTRLRVTISEPRRHSVLFTLPNQWPPRNADGLLRGARRVFRSLGSVAFEERLSDGRRTIVSRWKLETPNRLSYRIRGSDSGVIIGARRWDKFRGQRTWTPGPAVPAHQPSTIWSAGSYDARVIGTGRLRGRRARIVSFVDPKGPAWFTVWLDAETNRTLALRMLARAHFMQHRYSNFNAPPTISPPTR